MLDRLLGALAPSTDEEEVPFSELSEEEQQEVLAREKSERVEWHRRNVRNGPTRFTTVTPGRQASRARRDKKVLEGRTNRRYRRRHIAAQQSRAILRGQLQAVGAVPYGDPDFKPSMTLRLRAGEWIVRHFGERDDEGRIILHDDVFTDAVAAAHHAYAGKR